MAPSTEKSLIRDLRRTGKALGLTPGATDQFIEAALPLVKKSLAHRTIITDTDLHLAVSRALSKYNRDFAYVYKIRDIII